jgi:lysophospholipase L1-like esterase
MKNHVTSWLTLLATITASLITATTAYAQSPIRVACVGDSITAGSGLPADAAYPSQLQALLGKDWHIENFGVSGRTLLQKGDFPYRKDPAYQKALQSRPQIVIIMLGTNDTKPHNWKFAADFYTDYLALVESFEKLPTKPAIFLCRPCPIPGGGNFGINDANLQPAIRDIDRLIAEKKLGLIDMHAALKDFPELLPDRVHPNTTGATKMAEAAAQALKHQKTP